MTNDTDILGAAEGSRHFDAIIIGAGQALLFTCAERKPSEHQRKEVT